MDARTPLSRLDNQTNKRAASAAGRTLKGRRVSRPAIPAINRHFDSAAGACLHPALLQPPAQEPFAENGQENG